MRTLVCDVCHEHAALDESPSVLAAEIITFVEAHTTHPRLCIRLELAS